MSNLQFLKILTFFNNNDLIDPVLLYYLQQQKDFYLTIGNQLI